MTVGTSIRGASVGRLTPGKRLLTSALLLGIAYATAAAQVTSGTATSSTPAQPASFKYYVWGEVGRPGVYRLGPSLDIIELLSQAGGPTEGADLSRVALVQGFDQRKITVNVGKALESGNVISLSPGDVVIVPKSLGYVIRSEVSWISTFLVTLNVLLTLVSIFRT